MPKIDRTLFIVLICSIFVISCDSEGDTIPLEDLAGTWDITALSVTNCIDPNDNSPSGQGIVGCVTENGMEACTAIALTFTETGNTTTVFTSTLTDQATGQSQTQTEEQNSTFTMEGNDITICTDGDCDTYSLSIAGTTLSINGVNSDDGCTTSLTGTKRG